MFSIGDKIVYPMYGAGIIEDLQEKIIDGSPQNYYVMRIPIGDLKIFVSALKAEDIGIRRVYNKDEILRILSIQTDVNPPDVSENWSQRNKDNINKIKTGNFLKVLEVYRSLAFREKEKGLSSAEKKILTAVKQIIMSELIVTQEIDKKQAEEMLAESF